MNSDVRAHDERTVVEPDVESVGDAPDTMLDAVDEELVRIGELSRRVGVSDHTLRAWETRYGLLRPHRTVGGFRLYSAADEDRIRRMRDLLDRGLSPSEAARVVLHRPNDDTVVLRLPDIVAAQHRLGASPYRPRSAPQVAEPLDPDADGPTGRNVHAEAVHAIAAALDGFDDKAAHAVIDGVLADFSVETVLRRVLLPFLSQQGHRWERGEINLIQEHFASHVIRGRLSGLARGWAGGTGPRVVVACPPHELHDLAPMMFGITLHEGGWRVIFLGADTPVGQIYPCVRPAPDLVMLAATQPGRFKTVREDIATLAAQVPTLLAGAGATPRLAEALGAHHVDADPITAAQRILRDGVPSRS